MTDTTETAQQDTDLQAKYDELLTLCDERGEKLNHLADAFREVNVRFADAGLESLIVQDDGAATMTNLVDAYKQMESDRDTAQNDLAALQAKVDDAALKDAKKGKASPAPRRDGEIRAIGPLKLKNDEKQLSGEDLMKAIAAADKVEVVFSNGKKEIADLPPLQIAGDAWIMSVDRVKLNVPSLIVHGPAIGKPGLAVAGYGLLLDDKLAAYAPRGDVLQIGANAQVNLKDDIIF